VLKYCLRNLRQLWTEVVVSHISLSKEDFISVGANRTSSFCRQGEIYESHDHDPPIWCKLWMTWSSKPSECHVTEWVSVILLTKICISNPNIQLFEDNNVTVYTLTFSVPYDMFVSFSNRGTRTIRNQLCNIFAGARPSCRKIRKGLNKSRTWQHSQSFPRVSRKQLHISWRKVSWKENMSIGVIIYYWTNKFKIHLKWSTFSSKYKLL